MSDYPNEIGTEENNRLGRLSKIQSYQELSSELMNIVKILKDSMTTVRQEESQDITLRINIQNELKAASVIIEQEFKNQKEQKSKQQELVKKKMEKTENLIKMIFNQNQTTIFNSVLHDDKYVVTFKMFDHWDHFLDLCIIKLTKDSLRCTIHFCKENYEPIIVPDKLTRAQVSRLFIKKVSKIGGFVINPLSGQITFTYCTHNHLSKYTGDEFDTFLNRVIKSIFTSAYYMINYYLLSIFAKIGLISIPIYKEIETQIKICSDRVQNRKVSFLPDSMIRRLNNVIDLLENSTIQFDGFRNTDIYKQKISEEDKKDIEKQLDVYPKNGFKDKDSQLEPFTIQDYDEKKLKRISGGGFSEIYAVELQFQLQNKDNNMIYGFQDQQNTGLISNTFALKMQRKEFKENQSARDEAKIQKEVAIIHEIQPKCKYVAKYFYDQTKPDHLFMELYYFTLGSYAHFHNSIMSLNTRLYMTLQVAQGVKFLQAINIYHLDLKPPNILLDDELSIKICDFGESYCQAIHKDVNKFQKTGRTLPYSPIESLNGNTFSSASDVYSVGAIISEIIFDKRLIEFKRINQQKLQQKLVSRNYRLIYSDLVIKEFGIKQIMKILKVLMFKCVNPEPSGRPHIEYIIAILQLVLKVLNELY